MFYDRFTILCNERGLSPSKAALDNGVSKTSATRWKNGATPNGDILTRLAEYFDVSIDYLLGKTDAKKPVTIYSDGLSDDEKEYLTLYRSLTEEEKSALLVIARRRQLLP